MSATPKYDYVLTAYWRQKDGTLRQEAYGIHEHPSLRQAISDVVRHVRRVFPAKDGRVMITGLP